VISEIGPLLSSVSVMLAAFGFFYTTQRERIEAVIDDTDVPDAGTARDAKLQKAMRARSSAAVLCLAALLVWILLLDEIWSRMTRALEQRFDLEQYSTADVIFFVAANAWLLVAGYIGTRWYRLIRKVSGLRPPPRST
jgi:hypothetical protein